MTVMTIRMLGVPAVKGFPGEFTDREDYANREKI
jgi:hypothetical protein